MLGKNDSPVDAGWGLADYELVTSFSNCNIMGTYQFRDDFIRQTVEMEFANQLARGLDGREYRDYSPAYLRTSNKRLQDDFYGNSRCVDADTYDHTQKMPAKRKYNDKAERNAPGRTFRRDNRYRYNQRV